MDKRTAADSEQRKAVAAQIWLRYYNETLCKAGVITQRDYRRMRGQIERYRPSTS